LNIDNEFEDPEGDEEDLTQQELKRIADINKDNSKYFLYKDISSIYFIFPEYVKQLTDLDDHKRELPGGNKTHTVL